VAGFFFHLYTGIAFRSPAGKGSGGEGLCFICIFPLLEKRHLR